jgi:hypothetical protein
MMMYRVVAVIGGALALAACSSSPDWMSLDGLKPAPLSDNVSFETNPPGAEAKTSTGQTCRTPCALALPTSGPVTVTFTLAGHQPESETLELIQETGQAPRLRPNPVFAELTAAPPPVPARPARRPAKKPAAKKPAAAAAQPRPAAAAPAPAPASAQPAPAASPWPTTPQR